MILDAETGRDRHRRRRHGQGAGVLPDAAGVAVPAGRTTSRTWRPCCPAGCGSRSTPRRRSASFHPEEGRHGRPGGPVVRAARRRGGRRRVRAARRGRPPQRAGAVRRVLGPALRDGPRPGRHRRRPVRAKSWRRGGLRAPVPPSPAPSHTDSDRRHPPSVRRGQRRLGCDSLLEGTGGSGATRAGETPAKRADVAGQVVVGRRTPCGRPHRRGRRPPAAAPSPGGTAAPGAAPRARSRTRRRCAGAGCGRSSSSASAVSAAAAATSRTAAARMRGQAARRAVAATAPPAPDRVARRVGASRDRAAGTGRGSSASSGTRASRSASAGTPSSAGSTPGWNRSPHAVPSRGPLVGVRRGVGTGDEQLPAGPDQVHAAVGQHVDQLGRPTP